MRLGSPAPRRRGRLLHRRPPPARPHERADPLHPAEIGRSATDRSRPGRSRHQEAATMSAMSAATLLAAQRGFVSALPALQKNFRYLFRRRWRDRDDLLAEAHACAWKAWIGL